MMIKHWCATICATLALSLAAGNSSAETITIATGEYSPFTVQDSKYGGFVNRVIKEAFSRQGVTVEFSYLPWKRALEETRSGKLAASSFWFFDQEREKEFIHSAPISEHRELLFHLSSISLPEWQNITDLSKFTFGATRGYTYTTEFWEGAKSGKLNVSEIVSDEQNFQKLIAGRVDVFPVDEVTGWQLINSKFPVAKEKIKTHTKPLRVTEGHLIFPKKNTDSMALVEKFNTALAEMRADGTYDKYFQELFAGEF